MLCLPGLFSEWFSFTPMAHNFLPMPGPLADVKNQRADFTFFLIPLLFFCLPACQSGFFKPAQGDEACLPCPINSRTTNNGATSCVCRNNYYRTDSDPIQMPCTSKSLHKSVNGQLTKCHLLLILKDGVFLVFSKLYIFFRTFQECLPIITELFTHNIQDQDKSKYLSCSVSTQCCN